MSQSKTPSRGLTLVEVVVVLALGLLLVVAVQALALAAFKAESTLAGQVRDNQADDLASDVFRWDLENLAAPAGLRLRDNGLVLAGLVSVGSDRLAARQRVEVVYEITAQVDGLQLVRRESDPRDEDTPTFPIVLQRAVDKISFAVYDGRSWHHRWPPETPRLPRAVRLTLARSGSETETIVRLAPHRWARHD